MDTIDTNGAAHTPNRRCPHCHRPILVEAFAPRWRGYCQWCARSLSSHHHIESA